MRSHLADRTRARTGPTTLALNFDWLTNLMAILFVVACLYDARYDEYGTLTLSAAAMGLAVMAIEWFFKPAFEMSL
ncbi:hypothetical protein [Paraburkholderia sp. BCC1886]|uniref:hypothetical protein n=1 Tax=Paraburkholderia sp. BCC1886 TaxID=2562670 RepID=UPI0011842951|nr:hypothetical protein [Paraburkholderia sp. BCC1886]